MSEATVLSDTRCHLGEGPIYDPDSDSLFWFDILEQRLLEKSLSGGEERHHALPLMASALAFTEDRRQLLLTESGLYIRDPAGGRLTPHIAVEADNPATRSNDGRVHPSGAFWFGTMSKTAERGAGAIYWHRKGELRKLFDGITIPNAICFSPDGAVAYYADTREKLVFRVSCDPQTGLPAGEAVVFLDLRGAEGSPDGAVVDADGIIWNASWGAGQVNAYGPDGTLLRSVPLPAKQTSCPAFAGGAADRLAVTSAWEGMSEADRSKDPEAGKVFMLDLGLRGRFEPRAAI